MGNSKKLNVGLATDIMTGAFKFLTVTPEKVQQILDVVKEIDDALAENYSGAILFANRRACSLFPEIIFAPLSGVIRTDEQTLTVMSFTIQKDSLLAIRRVLVCAVGIRKAGQIFQESGLIVLKQLARKNL